jgi:hypothetical protein
MSTPTLDLYVSSGVTSGTGTSYNHNNSGSYLRVGIGAYNNPSGSIYTVVNKVTFNGILLTKAADIWDGGRQRDSYFYLNNAPVGNYPIVVNLAGSCSQVAIDSVSYFNAIFTEATGTYNASTTSISLATLHSLTAVQLAEDAAVITSSGVTKGGSQTLLYTDNNYGYGSYQTGTGIKTFSWSWSGSQRAATIVATLDYHIYSQILTVEQVIRSNISKAGGVALASLNKIAGLS